MSRVWNLDSNLKFNNFIYKYATGDESMSFSEPVKNQLKYLDKYDGNIDTLTNRISNVRTWSYVANNFVVLSDIWL